MGTEGCILLYHVYDGSWSIRQREKCVSSVLCPGFASGMVAVEEGLEKIREGFQERVNESRTEILFEQAQQTPAPKDEQDRVLNKLFY